MIRLIYILFLIGVSLMLASCSNNDHYIKVQKEIAALSEDAIKQQGKTQVTLPTLPQAVTYQYQVSPFVNASQRNTADGKNAKATSTHPLTDSPASDYQYVGFLERNDETRAYVSTSNGLVYPLQVGTPIGDNQGKVTKMTKEFIEITEPALQNGVPRKIILKLKD